MNKINFPKNHVYIRFPKDKLNIVFNKYCDKKFMRLVRTRYNGISLSKEEFIELLNNKDKILKEFDK